MPIPIKDLSGFAAIIKSFGQDINMLFDGFVGHLSRVFRISSDDMTNAKLFVCSTCTFFRLLFIFHLSDQNVCPPYKYCCP